MARIIERQDRNGKPVYYVDYRENGKRFRVRVGESKTAAREWLRQAVGKRSERRLMAKVYGEEIREIEPIALDKYAALYFARVSMLKRSRKTEAGMLTGLIGHFGGSFPEQKPGEEPQWPVELTEENAKDFKGSGPLLAEITTEKIERFKAALAARDLSPATRNRYRSLLHFMFQTAIKWGYARRNPVTGVQREKEENGRTRVLSADEEKRLFDGVAEDGNPVLPEPARTIALFALHTGCRWSEIIGLTKECVDLEGKKIIIPASNAKSKKERYIPLNGVALALVTAALKRGMGRNRVFTYDDGTSVKSIRTVFKGALAEANIEGFTFHCLRHSFGSRLIAAGADVNTVKELMGHHSIVLTQRYLHSADSSKRAAVELLTEKHDNVDTKRTTWAASGS
jgi:integrase